MKMQKHFVTFYSPGTFVSEETIEKIDSWDVDKAIKMSRKIVERYNAIPFGFQFSTRERGKKDLDSKETKRSGMYYLGGDVFTLEQVKALNDPKNEILIQNMECNKYEKVIRNQNSFTIWLPINAGDVVLDGDFTKEGQGCANVVSEPDEAV